MRYSLSPTEYGQALMTPDGRTVFEYLTARPAGTDLSANSVCCFHPVNTPSGERVTDFAPGNNEHLRGVFLAWHAMEFREKADFAALGRTRPPRAWNINRADFWGWGQYAPTGGRIIRNRDFALVRADSQHAELEITNEWTVDGRVMALEETAVVVRERERAYVVALVSKLTPAQDLVLDQAAFGGLCVRARNDGEAFYFSPRGNVSLPDPHYSVPELNWPPEQWYDFTITLRNGKTVGAAVIDHPANPRPAWHNPRYLAMLNPCIATNAPVRLEPGVAFRLRYRLAFHDGPAPAALLDRLAAEWRG